MVLNGVKDTGQEEIEMKRRFNNDLLVEKKDQDSAREMWPEIAVVLIHQELADLFRPHERRAKRLKLWVQWLGTIAVVCMVVALLGAAYEALAAGQNRSIPAWVGLAGGILGLFGLILACVAFLLRRRWLKNRFITEYLRLWHFAQVLDGKAIGGIGSEVGDEADRIKEYEEKRQQKLLSLKVCLGGQVGQLMDRFCDGATLRFLNPEPDNSSSGKQWPTVESLHEVVVDAYFQLRLEHQINFAVYKLGDSDRTFAWVPLRKLKEWSDFLAAATLFFSMLVVSVGIVIKLGGWVPIVTLALAVLGVGVRTWRDGLAVNDELERYGEMRHRLELLKARWEHGDDEDKLQVAEDIEQAGIAELRAFLRVHKKAQFLM